MKKKLLRQKQRKMQFKQIKQQSMLLKVYEQIHPYKILRHSNLYTRMLNATIHKISNLTEEIV